MLVVAFALVIALAGDGWAQTESSHRILRSTSPFEWTDPSRAEVLRQFRELLAEDALQRGGDWNAEDIDPQLLEAARQLMQQMRADGQLPPGFDLPFKQPKPGTTPSNQSRSQNPPDSDKPPRPPRTPANRDGQNPPPSDRVPSDRTSPHGTFPGRQRSDDRDSRRSANAPSRSQPTNGQSRSNTKPSDSFPIDRNLGGPDEPSPEPQRPTDHSARHPSARPFPQVSRSPSPVESKPPKSSLSFQQQMMRLAEHARREAILRNESDTGTQGNSGAPSSSALSKMTADLIRNWRDAEKKPQRSRQRSRPGSQWPPARSPTAA